MFVVPVQILLQRKLHEEHNWQEAATVGTKLLKTFNAQHDSSRVRRDVLKVHMEVLMELKKYGDVETLAIRALDRYVADLGKSHIETINCMNMLANSLHFQQKYAQAARLYVKTLEMQLEHTPTDINAKDSQHFHEQLVNSFRDIAHLYIREAAFDAGGNLLDAIARVQTRTFGVVHPASVKSLSELALFFCAIRNIEYAEPAIKELIDIFTKLAGPHSEEVIIWKKNLGSLFLECKQPEAAEAIFMDCLQELRKFHSDDHQEIVEIREMLATINPAPEDNKVVR
jgi:tetratricopeptide (TPR) repeat protein